MDSIELVNAIAAGPQGPHVIAAFDFEGALVGASTAAMLIKERLRRKDVSLRDIAQSADVTLMAMVNLLDRSEVMARSVEKLAGKTEREMEELGAYIHEHGLQDAIYPEMRQIVAAHHQAGHTLVVATSAIRHQVEPAIQALGIAHLLCTSLEVVDGTLTGRLAGEVMTGAVKAAAIERFVADHGGRLADAHVYADGDDEIALMASAGHPHPVNPARKLAAAARENGWPVLRLRSRTSAKPADVVRGVAGLLSVVPILQTSFALSLLSGNKRDTANLVMPTWLQAQLSLAGVKLRVWGRTNLRARRPAVFVFNHRNNFDASFVAALVQTDYVTVAKKEMAKNPIGKLVASIAPTIFVDRNAGEESGTADTLQQIMAALEKGKSIIIAPEGTRVRGHQDSVGRFRMGAFHIAMTAHVPIIPVVIRNALDVASHSGALRSGTVDIAVLAPVSVEGGERRQLAVRAREVRQMFVDTLAAWPPLAEADPG